MFNWKRKSEPDSLDYLIDEVQIQMRTMDPESDEFKTALARLKDIRKLKDDDRPKRVSPDTIAIVVANLLGILIIVKHEDVNVITSKATGFVQKLR